MRRRQHLAAPLAVRVQECQDARVVLGYHIIFTAYGFWLPNDPRGSWSEFVAAWELFLHGARRRLIQRDPELQPLTIQHNDAQPSVRFHERQFVSQELRRNRLDMDSGRQHWKRDIPVMRAPFFPITYTWSWRGMHDQSSRLSDI